ncbi:MAG TPA: Ppx/GppA phosphatase family protein [Nitrososphaera sp.]|jgi:exopolyphosphatase/guanosine-5'-triphosphate,3'-diphosphate pyrophosphatase|nr:Ppx/GppA phosphatase family protein [Nitrososphaera sp.]
MKVSVIDLGFNSVKLVNYDIAKDGTFRPYQQEGVKVKLGEGLHKTGYLGKEPVRRTIDALKIFKDIIHFDSVRHVLPVATSAVREAGNSKDFLEKVRVETGFVFKILSEQEEALYSYIGAIRATCLPTTLFFDLGGGSIELVYTENYNIRRIKSYPLGALRLTQRFGRSDGTFSKKNGARLVKHVLHSLPDPKTFCPSPDTTLVGVGGTLRAMARYDQEKKDYALDKIHNYHLDYEAVSKAAGDFSEMDADELSETEAIGSNRVETITAGSAIIHTLMRKFGFEKVVVSAEGLREGVLSVFVRDPRTFYKAGGINNEKAKAHVTFACQPELLPEHTVTFVRQLVNGGLMREKEKTILAHAIKEISRLPAMTNVNNMFYLMIDEDSSFLSHREQLILALSIIHARKEKAASWLISRYRSILEPQNKRSIEKVSACLELSTILERGRMGARLGIKGSKVDIRLAPNAARQFVPPTLLARAVKKFEQAFDVSVNCSVVTEKETIVLARKSKQGARAA